MKTASAKAKGRRLQDRMVRILRELGERYGLVKDDIKPAIMGTSGVDVVFSPIAKQVFNLDIECKNVEHLNVVNTFLQHYKKYESRDTTKLLVHSKNHVEPMVTLRLDDFVVLYSNHLRVMSFITVTPKESEGEEPTH